MVVSARQIVFDALEALPPDLSGFVERQFRRTIRGDWRAHVLAKVRGLQMKADGDIHWDQFALLKSIKFMWRETFAPVLEQSSRAYVEELLDLRNRISHAEPLTMEDAERALDTLSRLAEAIGARELAEAYRARRRAMPQTPSRIEGADTKHDTAAKSQADRIRDFVIATYLKPARAAGRPGFHVRAGDVHRAMGLTNAMPSVCSALSAQKFCTSTGVQLFERTGPHAGATVTFRFVFNEDAS